MSPAHVVLPEDPSWGMIKSQSLAVIAVATQAYRQGEPQGCSDCACVEAGPRQLIVTLPNDKFRASVVRREKKLSWKGYCCFLELNQSVGQVNHSAYITMLTCHFLGQLRGMITPHQHRVVRIPDKVKQDLRL
jgi:hypothetical protein